MSNADDDLIKFAASLTTKEDFVNFLQKLQISYKSNLAIWENNTLPEFLEAMAAWADGCQNFYEHNGIKIDSHQPQWRVFADILLAARVYE